VLRLLSEGGGTRTHDLGIKRFRPVTVKECQALPSRLSTLKQVRDRSSSYSGGKLGPARLTRSVPHAMVTLAATT
jgi:hypothetical protein